jgi:hypothetical protein
MAVRTEMNDPDSKANVDLMFGNIHIFLSDLRKLRIYAINLILQL